MGGRSDRGTGLATHALLYNALTKSPSPHPNCLLRSALRFYLLFFLLFFPMQSAMLCPSYPALLFLHALFCNTLRCQAMGCTQVLPNRPHQPRLPQQQSTTYHLPPDLFLAASTYIDPTQVFACFCDKQSKSGDQIWMLPETATPALVFVLMGKI